MISRVPLSRFLKYKRDRCSFSICETLPHQGSLGRLLEFYAGTEGAKAMPERRDERIVETETEARAGVTGHNVRYVLALGLGGVIVAFAIIHMTYWAAATAAMANAREKTSCLKAVMPRTVAWEAAQIA
jgi:hypothetical protein